jgi:hypothetical protein
VNNPLLEGIICRWLLLFQEFSFELIVKHGKNNVGLDLLSWMQSSELGGKIDDQLPNVDLFWVKPILDYLEGIAYFLTIGSDTTKYSTIQKSHLVVRGENYQ